MNSSKPPKPQAVFGNKIYIRGLVEISSICKRDCRYCGLRRSNPNAVRYRLAPEQILSCCEKGYALGFRTFVLQGGEDGFFSDEVVCGVVREIKRRYPDCAVTLSLGERGDESFRRLYAAGADRYLLRHETADLAHYAKHERRGAAAAALCPQTNRLSDRRGLYGRLAVSNRRKPRRRFAVPQKIAAADVRYRSLYSAQGHRISRLFAGQLGADAHPAGGYPAHASAYSLACLPATTALGTIHPQGRELGILHGANVVMPNLSPLEHRKDYAIYDNKICTGDEAAECIRCLSVRMKRIGYQIVTERGDYRGSL